MKPNAGGSPQKPGSRANAFGGVLHWMRSRKGALVLVSAFAVVAWAKPIARPSSQATMSPSRSK